MSITSLTSVSSGGITSAASGLLYVVSSDDAYRFTLADFPITALGEELGAMWQCHSAYNISAFSITSMHLVLRSLGYDDGSWTNAACPGYFFIPNNNWSAVEIGYFICGSAGFAANFNMEFYINGTKQNGAAGQQVRHTNNEFFDSGMEFSWIETNISSGDRLDIRATNFSGILLIESSNNNWWIRGKRRA